MIHIALLRGINVGGKHRLPMQDLRAMFEAAGCTAVQTYIQSGNVVFEASPEMATQIPERIARAIRDQCGFDSPVVTRTASELQNVAASNPFLTLQKQEANPKALHVAFLMDKPSQDQIAALEPDRSPPDEFTVRGREIYLRCPNGVARTRLTNQYFDSRLKTTSTMRNWKTVLRLLDMTSQ